jgi:hypothetical protein
VEAKKGGIRDLSNPRSVLFMKSRVLQVFTKEKGISNDGDQQINQDF